jgi:hypothetical protein
VRHNLDRLGLNPRSRCSGFSEAKIARAQVGMRARVLVGAPADAPSPRASPREKTNVSSSSSDRFTVSAPNEVIRSVNLRAFVFFANTSARSRMLSSHASANAPKSSSKNNRSNVMACVT